MDNEIAEDVITVAPKAVLEALERQSPERANTLKPLEKFTLLAAPVFLWAIGRHWAGTAHTEVSAQLLAKLSSMDLTQLQPPVCSPRLLNSCDVKSWRPLASELEPLDVAAIKTIAGFHLLSPDFIPLTSQALGVTPNTSTESTNSREIRLSDDVEEWRDELDKIFREASPELYSEALRKGRLAPNLNHLVSANSADWLSLVASKASQEAKEEFKNERLFSKLNNLAQSTLRPKPASRAKEIDGLPVLKRPVDFSEQLEPREPDFYVFGPARSGTTLIGSALSTAENLFVLNDTMVLTRLFSMDFMVREINQVAKLHNMASDFPKSVAIDNFDEAADVNHVKWLLSLLMTTYYNAGSNTDEPNKNLANFKIHGDLLEMDKIINEARAGATWRRVLASIYGSLIPPAEDVSTLGEKTPDNIKFHAFIKQKWPCAKRICVVREPLNNIASIYTRYPVKDLDHVLPHYLEYAKSLLELDSDDTMFIRYEDFIENPQAIIDVVATFLNVPTWDLPAQFQAYNMPEYTGSKIDPARGNNIDFILKAERDQIYAATEQIYERFQFEKNK